MATQTSSVDRAAALRRCALSFEKACSIGFRSGEYLGKKIRLAPTARMAGFALVRAEIVENDDIA